MSIVISRSAILQRRLTNPATVTSCSVGVILEKTKPNRKLPVLKPELYPLSHGECWQGLTMFTVGK